MGRKVGKGCATKAIDFWKGLQGWKQVDVGDDLLLGADEYGFCGLEELDATALGDIVIHGATSTAGAEEQAAADGENEKEQHPAKKGKGKKRKQPEAAAEAAAADGSGGEGEEKGATAVPDGREDVAALKEQLAVLQAENKQLKQRQKKEERQEKQAAAATKREELKAAKHSAAVTAASAAAASAAAAQAVAVVDVSAWGELELHPSIKAAIAALGFEAPTQVQAECLPAAIRDRRDIIGAAQTGSGKTLAFGLPIMQLLVQERQVQVQQVAAAGHQQQAQQHHQQVSSALRALILAPTRELALQVCEHLQAVGKPCGIWAVPIVGGISALKQERLLSKHPQVIVATPGRLWDLMREGHTHVTDLSGLSFLVIDEADRMVQQGHYGELSSILGSIPVHQQLVTPETPEPQSEPEEATKQVAPAAGEAPKSGYDRGEGDGTEEAKEEGKEQEEEEQQQAPKHQLPQGKQRQALHRLQTFVFSATLTLPATLRKRLHKGGGGASGSSDLDGLMDKIPFRGKPKIVDLTSKRRLADKVEEAYIACGEAHRDEYLYCLLAKHPGRTIVFVNAISSVRRLGAILKLLGLPAQALHAGMQQRQRLRALDRFRADPNAVLVATDVAARGLDIKDVRCVVHYQLPASVDVYVHRSGRTARAEAEGISVALVTPKENARFLALLRAMKREEPPEFPLDMSLMPAVHRRVRLAVRLDELERRQSKESAERSWRQQHAEHLGIELSDEDEEDEDGGSGRRQGRKAKRNRGGKRGPEEAETAARVRFQLAELLAEPLQPKFSSKWFTGGAAAAVMAAMDPSGPVAGSKRKKKAQVAAGAAARGQQKGENGQQEAAEPMTAQTVHQAVALAQRRSDSLSKVATAKQQHAAAAGGSKRYAKRKQQGNLQAAALQAALSKAMAAKQKKKASGHGMLVIPRALGRDIVGPDALQTLRQKLGGF